MSSIILLGSTDRLQTVDLRSLIVRACDEYGVPSAIGLAVAQRESGIQQWHRDGSLVVGSKGEIGAMQLMPDTARQLRVDAADPEQNIRGGVQLLRALYDQFGTWYRALEAYNWGSGNLTKALSQGRSAPASVEDYAGSIALALPSSTLASVATRVMPNTSPAAKLLIGGGILLLGILFVTR